jgi:hypothetical protein
MEPSFKTVSGGSSELKRKCCSVLSVVFKKTIYDTPDLKQVGRFSFFEESEA